MYFFNKSLVCAAVLCVASSALTSAPAVAASQRLSKAVAYLLKEQIAVACRGRGGRITREGFIQRDLTGDGRDDLIIDHSGIRCNGPRVSSHECGTRACAINFYVREGRLLKYKGQFLGMNAVVDGGQIPAIHTRGHEQSDGAVYWTGYAFEWKQNPPAAVAGAQSDTFPNMSSVALGARFTDYASADTLKSAPRFPDFNGRDRAFKDYRTRIRDGVSGGVNFAGHYSFISIGCGTECQFGYVVDLRTGEVFDFPYGGEGQYQMNLRFAADSRLVRVRWKDSWNGDTCTEKDLLVEGTKWRTLDTRTVPTDDGLCYYPPDIPLEQFGSQAPPAETAATAAPQGGQTVAEPAEQPQVIGKAVGYDEELKQRWLVKEQYLQTLGFDPGPVDGAVDVATALAVNAFQKTYGLEVLNHLPSKHFAILEALAKAKGFAAGQTQTQAPRNASKPPQDRPSQPPQKAETDEKESVAKVALPSGGTEVIRTGDNGTGIVPLRSNTPTQVKAETKAERHQRIVDFAQNNNLGQLRTASVTPSDEQIQLLAMALNCEGGGRRQQESCIEQSVMDRHELHRNFIGDRQAIIYFAYSTMFRELPILRKGVLEEWTDKYGRPVSKDRTDRNVYGGVSNLGGKRFFCPDEPKLRIAIKPNWLKKKKSFIQRLRGELASINVSRSSICLERGEPVSMIISIYYEKQLIKEFTVPEIRTIRGRVYNPDAIGKREGPELWKAITAARDGGSTSGQTDAPPPEANPFKNANGVDGRDFRKSDLVYVFDGEFDKIPLPLEGASLMDAYLRALVNHFFEGLAEAPGLLLFNEEKACYPTGSIKVPWTRHKEDNIGNIIAGSEEEFTAFMPRAVVPTFKSGIEENLYTLTDSYYGVQAIIRQYGCNSEEYKTLYSQILSLNNGLLNGFPEKEIDKDTARFKKKHVLALVNNCLEVYPSPNRANYEHCVCMAHVSKEFYKDPDKYMRWSRLSPEKNAAYNERVKAECPAHMAGTGGYRKPISDLIKDLARDVKF